MKQSPPNKSTNLVGSWMALWLAVSLASGASTGTLQATYDFQNDGPFIEDDRARRQFSQLLQEARRDGRCANGETLATQLGRTGYAFDPPPAPSQPLAGAELYRRCAAGTVMVGRLSSPRSSRANVAGGFVLDPSGIIVTNHHVVESAAESDRSVMGVMTFDGRVYPVVEVLAASKPGDAALLRVDTGGDRLTALPLAETPAVGAKIYALHHPDGSYFVFTEGVVSRFFRRGRGGDVWDEMAITADFARGSSGSPILNEAGAVVGIVRATRSIYYDRDDDGNRTNLQMVWKLCVPSTEIRKLCEKDESGSGGPLF